MTWYGGDSSGRDTPWKVGDLVRYDDGPSALMRVVHVRDMGPDQPRCAPMGMNRWRYYGRGYHDNGSSDSEHGSVGRYHGQCREPTAWDRKAWAWAHDKQTDEWIRGRWGYRPTHVVLAILSSQGRSYVSKPLSLINPYRLDPKGTEASTYEELIRRQGAHIIGRWIVHLKERASC